MLKVVVDTNVWVSAVLGTGVPKKLKDRMAKQDFQPICSTQLVDELIDVLARPKFSGKVTDIDAAELVRLLRKVALFVEPEPICEASRDPKDDVFLACAVTGGADYLVTGDDDLLALVEIGATKIVTPRQFLQVLEDNY